METTIEVTVEVTNLQTIHTAIINGGLKLIYNSCDAAKISEKLSIDVKLATII